MLALDFKSVAAPHSLAALLAAPLALFACADPALDSQRTRTVLWCASLPRAAGDRAQCGIPGLGPRWARLVVATAAMRIHSFTAHDRIPEDLEAWQIFWSTLARRRQHRTRRLRFRRDPAAWLARLEADFL